jgi:cytoskeletal protein RodZ
METVIAELKAAREAKGIPLAQIADITRIAEEHLLAIERGRLDVLPQVYVRAFLREYAEVVGLSPDEIMRKVDAAASRHSQKSSPPPETPPPAPAAAGPSGSPGPGSMAAPSRIFTPAVARFALIVTVVAVLAIVAWNLSTRSGEPATEEIPFQTVLKQEEERLAPARTPPKVVTPISPQGQPVAAGDSLTLRATITDSLWLWIQADDGAPREYLFPPGSRAVWRSGTRFLLSLGNAGAAEFTLNEKPLGVLGKRGAVLRNIEIGRQNLTTP